MASVAAQSMRTARTGDPLASPRSIRQSQSVPLNLETVNSDDSSVFSGLNSPSRHESSSLEPANRQSRKGKDTGVRFSNAKKSPRSRLVHIGRYKTKSTDSGESQRDHESVSVLRSGSGSPDSERGLLRNMESVADKDSAFGTDTTLISSVLSPNQDHNTGTDGVNFNDHNDYLFDQDASTMSYGSVNEFQRPKAKMKLLSEVDFLDQPYRPAKNDNQESQENQENEKPGEEQKSPPKVQEGVQEEKITVMLREYEKQMNVNLEIIKEDEECGDYLSELQGAIPRRVKSEEERQILTQRQARKMQRILHQARKEVEVLRDNNEQFMSEIEQSEEEHSSEMTLIEERTKHGMAEMKAMYQEELDSLTQEKDAAIVEAGRQAVRYTEFGRKQISSLKRQIEKLKAQANGAIKQTVEDAVTSLKRRKEEEMTARLGALRKSYENQLEKLRAEKDNQVKGAVNEAISSLTQRMLAERDREVNETMKILRKRLENEKNEAVQSFKKTLDESTHKIDESRHEINELRHERVATIKALESVKENVHNHYPEQMEQLRKKSKDESGALKLIREGTQSKSAVETLFKEVIESFAYLLDSSETKVASARYLSEIEELKKERDGVYVKARKELIMRHRAEMERKRKEEEDSKDKISRLEESLKNMGREKRVLDDKLRRATESHRTGIMKMQAEKDAILVVEKGRKELAIAMATGQLELAYSMANGREHFLKPKAPENVLENQSGNQQYPLDQAPKQSTDGPLMNESSRDEIEATRSRENEDEERDSGIASISHSENKTYLSQGEKIKRENEQNESLGPVPLSGKKSTHLHSETESRSNSNDLPPPPPPPPLPPPPLPAASPDAPSNETEQATAVKAPSIDPDAIKTSHSESSDVLRSSRSRTVLGMVRDQSKKVNEKKLAEAENSKEEPAGSKEVQKASESLKKKSFAILRSFKSSKDNGSPKGSSHKRIPEKQRDPETSTQGKEPEGKIESPHESSPVKMSLPRRARKIRNFLDHLKSDDSTRTRDSFTDGSLSSLIADTGASSPRSKSERDCGRLGGERDDCVNPGQEEDNGNGKRGASADTDNKEGSSHSTDGPSRHSRQEQAESSQHSRKSGWNKREGKKRSPLNMFAHIRKDKIPKAEEDSSPIEVSQDEHVEGATPSARKAAEKIEDKNEPSSANRPGTLSFKKGLPNAELLRPVASTQVESEPLKEKSAPVETIQPLRNLKRPNLPGFEGKGGEISPPIGHVINAKKPQMREWANSSKEQDGRDFIGSAQPESRGVVGGDNQIPVAISLRPSAKKQLVTPAAGGHTMCLRPLSIVNNKGHAFDSISGMSTDVGGFPVVMGVTSETATSTDDDCPPYDSQSQLRNYPALAGDDESSDDSDDDSSDYSNDKYASVEPPAQFAHEYPSTKSEGTHVPIVISRSVDEQSHVIYMDSSNESRPIVVQGRPIYRQPALSAFTPSPKRGASDTSSTTGSEATTAITAHTFRSSLQTEPKKQLPKSPRDVFRSALQTEPKRPLPRSPRDPQRNNNLSVRRAANFASARVRRVAVRKTTAEI